MSTKICPGCPEKGEQPLTNFHTSKRSKTGVQSRCKKCLLAYQAANRKKARERSIEWRKGKKKRSSKGGIGTLFPDVEEK